MLGNYIVPFVLFISSAYTSCLHGTSRLPRRMNNNGSVEVSTFGYTNLQGPLNWAGLSTENDACATGTIQSPINLDGSIPTAAVAPQIAIPCVDSAEFENIGSTVETIVNGTLNFEKTKYSLKQFHFHTPSEHRINEEYFPLEMHMVHVGTNGSGIVVLAVLFQLSPNSTTTEILKNVTQNIENIVIPGRVTETGPLNFTSLITYLHTTTLFQYTGSLTTPPCAEAVTFLVTKDPLPLDVQTFNSIKSVVKFNSRYTQNELGLPNLLTFAAKNNARIAAADEWVRLANGTGNNANATLEGKVATTTSPTMTFVTEIAIGTEVVPTSVIAQIGP
ncbi:carbonic anhydrase [Lepidopterella palustris CBS 459.81]|uniref:Carbonic anhydrase n=1 Tax=Lepidopterella palustris CBS 459.81 TaxID=1314670 RepID=A0A8E2E8W5_9PEZI|nr:carbonic anhydrase [Lepidopterella palustris CBS 459.81]